MPAMPTRRTLGAPVLQTDANANVTYEADYEPFGALYDLRRNQNPHQPLRLPGQIAEQFDGDANGATDLSYNGARWFRPQWGRYTSADPIGLSGGSDRFLYVGDSPLGAIDPLGLCKLELRAIPITEVGDAASHADLVLTDTDKNHTKYLFTAGPPGGPTVADMAIQPVIPFMREAGNMKPDGWGYLQILKPRHWKLEDDQYDRWEYFDDHKPCHSSCKNHPGMLDRFNKYYDQFRGKHHVDDTPYDPNYWNSNSMTFSALQDLGYDNAWLTFQLQNFHGPIGFPGAENHIR